MKNSNKITLFLILLITMTFSVYADSCTNGFVSSCDLNESLTLTQNYTDIENINIVANDVVLDCDGYTISGTWNGTENGRLLYPQEASGNHQRFTLQNCVINNVYQLFDTSPDYGAHGLTLDNVDITGMSDFEFPCGEGEGWEWCDGTYTDQSNIFGGNWGNSVAVENITIKNSRLTNIMFSAQDNDNWNDAENAIKKNFYVYNNIFTVDDANFPQVMFLFQTINGVYVYNNTFYGNDIMQNAFFTITDSWDVEVYDNTGYDGESVRIGQESFDDVNKYVLISNNNFEVLNVISIAGYYTNMFDNTFTVTNGDTFARFDEDMNITRNDFGSGNEISLWGSSTGNEYFYDNYNVNSLYDYTDYGAGDYITYCVDDVGNDNIVYYEGSQEWSGTCSPPSCSDGIVDGCMFTESTTLTADGEYYNLSLLTYSDDIVIDCNNSLFRAAERTDVDDVTFINIYNSNIVLKNCRFDGYTKIATLGESNNIVFDNIWDNHARTLNWQGNDYSPGNFYTVEDYSNFGRNVTINNSYISGEVQLNLQGQDIIAYSGDYCPDNEGEYVMDSENCLNWDEEITEENCRADMWNGTHCKDSRGTWQGGACNECVDDSWQWYDGEFIGCDLTTEPLNFVLQNSIINRTNSELTIEDWQMFDHDPFPFTFMASGINIINNSYYWPELSGQHSLMGRIAGGANHEIANNYFYGGKAGFSLTGSIAQYEGGDCQTINAWVHDNVAYAIESSSNGGFITNLFRDSVIENNIIDYTGTTSTSGVMTFGQVDNVTIRNNNITGLKSGYSMYPYWWSSDDVHNVSIYNNYFDGNDGYRLLVGGNSENNDVEFYNNTINAGILGLVAYQPDICKGGIGNIIGNKLQIYLVGDYDYTLDSDCPIINSPNGFEIFNEDEVQYTTNVNGNGVEINGSGEEGLSITLSGASTIENSTISNFKLRGFDKSMNITGANELSFSGFDVEDPYYDYGIGNTFSTFTVPSPEISLLGASQTIINDGVAQFEFSVYAVGEIYSCELYALNNKRFEQLTGYVINTKEYDISTIVNQLGSANVNWYVSCEDVFGNIATSSVQELFLQLSAGGGGGGVSTDPCVSVWFCTEYSVCADEIQTRQCIDLNSCGDSNSPALAQSCSYFNDLILRPSAYLNLDTTCVDIDVFDATLNKYKQNTGDVLSSDLSTAIEKWKSQRGC